MPAVSDYCPIRLPASGCSICPPRGQGFCAPSTGVDSCTISQLKGIDRRFMPGDEIYAQGEICPEYFSLQRGWVALSVNLENGKRHIIDFGLPGSFLGIGPNETARMSHSAQCITPTWVCPLSKHGLKRVMERNATLAMRLFHLTARGEARLQDHLANISCRNARERLAHLLVDLFYRQTRRLPSARGQTVALPLTLEHIGDATAMTSVHASRTLRVLREEGVLRVGNRKLEILDPERMLAAASFEIDVIDHDGEISLDGAEGAYRRG